MAISQSITVLPTPPSRADPDNFDARADAFLGALPTMQSQMNTWAGQANTTAAEIGIVSEGLLSVTPGANKVPLADGDGELALGWLDLTGYAPAAKGVTNGDSHNHNGGDGAQIAYSSLSGLPSLGKILQVVPVTSITEVTVASATYTDIGLSVTITPRDANSKILLMASFEVTVENSGGGSVGAHTRILRGATEVFWKSWSPFCINGYLTATIAYVALDSPATTSATTYKLQGRVASYSSGLSASFLDTGSLGSLIALEVAG
jgi:hypothetical protein